VKTNEGKKRVMISRTENKALNLKVFVFVQFIHKRKNQYFKCRLDSHRICKRVWHPVELVIFTEICFFGWQKQLVIAGYQKIRATVRSL